MEQPPVQTSKQGIKYYNGSVNGGRGRGWQIHVPGDVCTLTLASAHFSQILDERVHRVRAYANQQMPYENRFIGPRFIGRANIVPNIFAR